MRLYLLSLLIAYLGNAQQVMLSWPTNYGQVTVQYSTNGFDWTSIATGEFTNMVIDATNQQNASTLAFSSNGIPYWVADCQVRNMYRVWWDYTNTWTWDIGSFNTFQTQLNDYPHMVAPILNTTITITKL